MTKDISGFDLRKFQQGGKNHEQVRNLLGKIVSGREGYKTVVEKKKKIKKCESCENILEGCEKFCPECGEKLK